MKNYLLFFVALFVGIKCDAQTNYNLVIKKCVKYTDTTNMLRKYFRKSDTTSLSNRINTKLNITDTANIRFRPVAGSNIKLSGTYPSITIESIANGVTDTTSLSNRINTKLNITDTANIRFRPVAGSNITLSGTYPNITIASTGVGPSIDTTSLSNRINTKLNITDTANIRFRPVAGSNITLSGTYPNITIASSGGSSIDTTSLSNRINTKLNITDTANIRFRPVAGSNITLSGTYPNMTIGETKWSTDSNASLYIGTSSSTYNSTYFGTINFPDIAGTSTSGISFGGNGGYNLNLYRGATNYLRTDHSLLVGQVFYIGNTINKWSLTDGMVIAPSSLSGSGATSGFSLSQTWNTTGSPSLISANVTNTASGTGANLINLQVGGVSRFRVDKNGAVTVNNASQIISGTGSPEGVVTAGVGSMYLRTDGGAGTTLYIKETGTGATGWAAK